MSLDLPNIRAVMEAARLGSFSRAAEALNLTQPAFSRRIAEVELALEAKLFERLPRGVAATQACLTFLRHAEIALNSIENGREAARDAEGRVQRDIAFGVLENLCDDRLMEACKSVLAGSMGVSLTFRPRTLSAEISADLLAGATRLGLRYGRDPDPQLESRWIWDDPIAIACASSHPLAGAGKLTLDDLEQAQWIGASATLDDGLHALPEDMPAAIYSGWTMMQRVPIYARLKLLEAGFGLAMVRRACIAGDLVHGNIVELPSPVALSIPVFLVWRRGIILGAGAEKLCDKITSFLGNTALQAC